MSWWSVHQIKVCPIFWRHGSFLDYRKFKNDYVMNSLLRYDFFEVRPETSDRIRSHNFGHGQYIGRFCIRSVMSSVMASSLMTWPVMPSLESSLNVFGFNAPKVRLYVFDIAVQEVRFINIFSGDSSKLFQENFMVPRSKKTTFFVGDFFWSFYLIF